MNKQSITFYSLLLTSIFYAVSLVISINLRQFQPNDLGAFLRWSATTILLYKNKEN